MRVGIIGSGFGLYGLLPAFNAIKDCEVVSICGKKTERLTKYCESIGLEKIYTDWKLMLKNETIDAVAIAVVPSAQYEIAKYAMQNGIHVFAEKPLAVNYAQAKELYLLAKNNKIITAVDFIFPEIEAWENVKELISSKVYGELKHVSIAWDFISYDIRNSIKSWKTSTKDGGGALLFYVSHALYNLEFFTGSIDKVSANFLYANNKSLNGGEVCVDVLVKCDSGVNGLVHFSCISKGVNSHVLTFVCDEATIVLSSKEGLTKSFTIKVFTDGKELSVPVKKNKKTDEDERVAQVKKIGERFIAGCKNKHEITPSFSDGLRIQKLMEKISKKAI
jgi:predicted dehydrogenase